MKFVQVELENCDTKLRETVKPPSKGRLEYVDARVYLRDSMEPSDAEYFNESLYLADALSGDKHYERIVRSGTALTTDLKRANENREDFPKARATGGFIVKENSPPVVGQLGSQWLDPAEDDSGARPQRAISQMQKKSNRSAATFSTATAASMPLEPIRHAHPPCTASHWECEPCGSGTGEIIFCLRPVNKCATCDLKPLRLIHSSTSRCNSSENALAFAQTVPNKTFKLVSHLLNMDDGRPLEEFFAHFRIVF